MIEFARPYMPDLMGFLSKFAEVTSYYDANGHYARVSTAQANVFHYCEPGDTNSQCASAGGPYATGELAPIPPSQQFNDLTFGHLHPLPGRRDPADSRLQPVHRRRQPAHRRPAAQPEVRHLRRSPGAMRRIAAIIALLAVAALLLFGQASGGDGRRATRSGRSSTTAASSSPARRCGSPAPRSDRCRRWT